MKETVLHRRIVLPADQLKQEMAAQHHAKTDTHAYFIVLGMRAGDLGYRQVIHEVSKLGEVAHFNDGLLYLTTTLSIDEVFKRVNKSIVDPGIPSDVGLLILDPSQEQAKWYLNRDISQVLVENWHNKSNLFVCHDNGANKDLVYNINALGEAIPLSEHIWYVSTSYQPREAYQILTADNHADERVTVFDASGRACSWQSDSNRITIQLEHETPDLPQRATIHQPKSWQASMLASFL
ncbi:MAG: hypothetical protein AAF564_00800 [Bacteroidota bacterium]